MSGREEIGSHIYFVRCGDFIKIGWSSHFVRRIEHMGGMSPQPLELVGILEGSRKVERVLHRQFAAHRSHREWFRNEGALAEYIARRTEARLWSMSPEARRIAERFRAEQGE